MPTTQPQRTRSESDERQHHGHVQDSHTRTMWQGSKSTPAAQSIAGICILGRVRLPGDVEVTISVI